MAMVRRPWSISALAVELKRDRRTVAALVDRLDPAGTGPEGRPTFWLADVVTALTGARHAAQASAADRASAIVRFASLFLDEQTSGLAAALAKASKPAERERLIARAILEETLRTLLANERDEVPAQILPAGVTRTELDRIVEHLETGALASEALAAATRAPKRRRGATTEAP